MRARKTFGRKKKTPSTVLVSRCELCRRRDAAADWLMTWQTPFTLPIRPRRWLEMIDESVQEALVVEARMPGAGRLRWERLIQTHATECARGIAEAREAA